MPLPISSLNGTSKPYPSGGMVAVAMPDAGYYTSPLGVGTVLNIGINPGYLVPKAVIPSNQIAGLVPVFPCGTTNECRKGLYKADEIPDDQNYVIPVFGSSDITRLNDLYINDYNSFLFDFPNANIFGSSMTFFIDQLVGTTWTELAQLTDDSYGFYYAPSSLCSNVKWTGYKLYWNNVLAYHGEGKYRFRMQVVNFNIGSYSTCFASPAFCLKEYSCYAADGTTKFEVTYSGGKLGNIDKTNCGGKSWTFCCFTPAPKPWMGSGIGPITWNDSIRVEGFFGYEDTEYERKAIKYQNGFNNKIRDEAILKFKWRSGALPFWLHERFKVYCLLADEIRVSDYNINNSDYNLKRYCVQGTSSYNPEYAGRTRYTKVTTEFKPQTQYLIRTKCCDAARAAG